jgi:hypothetical protein
MLVLTTSRCAITPGCYLGVSLLPPGPFIHCGLDASAPDEEDGEEVERLISV